MPRESKSVYISSTEAARILHISESNILLLEKQGLLKSFSLSGNRKVFDKKDIEKFLSKDKVSLSQQAAEVSSQLQRDILHSLVFVRNSILLVLSSAFLYLFVVLLLATFFNLAPTKTVKWLGLDKSTESLALQNTDKNVLGVSTTNVNRSALQMLLYPVAKSSLFITKYTNPSAYSQITQNIIIDPNDVFNVTEKSLIPVKPILINDTKSLQIVDKDIVSNLNSEYIQGRKPGVNPGDIAIIGEDGTIDGIQIINNQAPSVSNTAIPTIPSPSPTTTIVQIYQTTNSSTTTGVSLPINCQNGQVASWNAATSSWACSTIVSTTNESITNIQNTIDETDTLDSVVLRGASTSAQLNLTGGLVLSSLSEGILQVDSNGEVSSVRGTAGQLLVADSGGMPTFVALSGDATVSESGSVVLKNTGAAGTYGSSTSIPVITTDAQGRITAATATAVSGLTVSSFGSVNISQWTNDSGYITAASVDTLTNKTISAANNTIIQLTDVNLSGNAGISNNNLANSAVTLNSGAGLTGGGLVSLGSATTFDIGEGDGIAVNAHDIGIRLSSTGTTGATASRSGLEVSPVGLTLLQGCTDGHILKWTDAGGWACTPDLSGSATNLSGITAATAANTITNGDNAQVWNWSLNTAAKTAFTFGESAVSTNGAGSQYLLGISTLPSSTAAPFRVAARGNTIINTTNIGGLTFGNTTLNTPIVIQSGAGAISIGADAVAKSVTVGNTTGNSRLNLNAGTGGVTISTGTSGVLSMTSGTTGMVTLDSGTTGQINIGTNANAKTVTIGSTVGISTLNLRAGLGGIRLTGLSAQTNGKVTVCVDTTSNQLFLGATATSCNSSSARFKHDISEISFGLDSVRKLRPVHYAYNSNNEQTLGFIAEEAALVDERLVVRDNSGIIHAINTDAFMPLVVKSIQELDSKVETIAQTARPQKTVSEEFQQLLKQIVEFFGKVVFHDTVTFLSSTTFKQTPIFGKNTTGEAIIKAGETQVSVTFDNAYLQKPMIHATLNITEEIAVGSIPTYAVYDVTQTGFTVKIAQPVASDIRFSWFATITEGQSTTISNGLTTPTPQQISPTPTAVEPTVTVTEPTITIEPTATIVPTLSISPTPQAE